MKKYNFENIYWIGGSPCAGKSTISRMLVKKYNFLLYKCDDYLDEHFKIGKERNFPIMSKLSNMTCDEIWMRPIDIQVYEEFEYYKEELVLILEELSKYSKYKKILVEGTAILPEFIEERKIEKNKVVFIVPTAEFQLKHYKEREFIPYVLRGCKNQEKAFENWMDRDIKFALDVANKARKNKMNLIVNDGNKSVEKNLNIVEEFFELV